MFDAISDEELLHLIKLRAEHFIRDTPPDGFALSATHNVNQLHSLAAVIKEVARRMPDPEEPAE